MEIVINENNLLLNDVNNYIYKSRALLVEDNNILLTNYNNAIMLPGGHIGEGESKEDTIIRELNEELGLNYSIDELTYLLTVSYFQKGYVRRNKDKVNRFLQTYYFIGKYKDINYDNQKLTNDERNGSFKLDIVSLDDIDDYINSIKNNNPRYLYFIKELLAVINYYKNNKEDIYNKIRTRKK